MTVTERVSGRATLTRKTRASILKQLDRLERSERRTRHIAEDIRYLVQVLGHEMREIVVIPHNDRFPSSSESPSTFYESESEGGDDDITPEVDDVEYVAPQERDGGEGTSGPPINEATEEDED